MRRQKPISAEEAIAGPEDRLVMDRPCETCGSEHFEKVDLSGRLYYRCAGTWSNGMDCNRLRPIPVLKDPAPVANLEGEAVEVVVIASPPRTADGGSGIADYETARKAMIASAEAVARRRGRW